MIDETWVSTPARIHPTVFLAPGAVVLGDVTLAARSSVWCGSVVRGDSAPVWIGEDSNVQDNSVVHEDAGLPARVGARVTIGHGAIVHGCVIEDECLIGMGAVILSGANIGTGSLVAAGSLVRENERIPPRSLVVGAPARVVGPVRPEHERAIQNGWSHYAQLAAHYLGTGLGQCADREGRVWGQAGRLSAMEWRACCRLLKRSPSWWEDRESSSALDRARQAIAYDRERVALLARGAVGEMGSHPAGQGSGGELGRPWPEWKAARRELCRLLEGLGPVERRRIVGHPTRGALRLDDLVREWVEEELDRRRALGASRERA